MKESNIYIKHAKIVQSLKAEKTHIKNENFLYRTLDDLLNELKPLLKKNHLTLIFNDAKEIVDGVVNIRSEATLIDIDNLDQFPIRSESSSSGKVTIMSPLDNARLNALCGMFLLSTSFDARDISEDNIDKLKNSGIPYEVI